MIASVNALSLTGPIPSSRVRLHVIFPNYNPEDMRQDAVSVIESRLNVMVPDMHVLNSIVRRGSTIMSLDLLLPKGSSNVHKGDAIAAHEWIDMLGLPEARDGEPLLIQVNDHQICLMFDGATKKWRPHDGPVPQPPCEAKFSMSTAAAACLASDDSSVQLQLKVTEGDSLQLPDTAQPHRASGIFLRAHCQGLALPVSWKAAPSGTICDLVVCLDPLPSEHGPQGSLHLPGLVTLEAWSGYKVVDTISVLVFNSGLEAVVEELYLPSAACQNELQAGMLKNVELLGSWMEYVSRLERGDAVALGALHADMQDTGRKMLVHAVLQGWKSTSEVLRHGLEETMKTPFSQLWKDVTDDGNTLLHHAALSLQPAVVQQVAVWAFEKGLTSMWTKENNVGATPLHLAAHADPSGGFGAQLSGMSIAAREAWNNYAGSLRVTPRAMSQYLLKKANVTLPVNRATEDPGTDHSLSTLSNSEITADLESSEGSECNALSSKAPLPDSWYQLFKAVAPTCHLNADETGFACFKAQCSDAYVQKCCLIRTIVTLSLMLKQFMMGQPWHMFILKLAVSAPLIAKLGLTAQRKAHGDYRLVQVWYLLRFLMHGLYAAVYSSQDTVEALVQPITDVAGALSEPILFRNAFHLNIIGAVIYGFYFNACGFQNAFVNAALVHGTALTTRYVSERILYTRYQQTLKKVM